VSYCSSRLLNMKSIVLLLYSFTSSWACRESLFDYPLHCKFPHFFIFLNKRNLHKLFLLCVFPKSLKTCIRTWADFLLISSDWSSIYQSSHWDTSQCQGVCGPFLSSVTKKKIETRHWFNVQYAWRQTKPTHPGSLSPG